MIAAISGPEPLRNLFLNRQLCGLAIATKAAPVAIQKQIRCRRRPETRKWNTPRSESSGPWMRAVVRLESGAVAAFPALLNIAEGWGVP